MQKPFGFIYLISGSIVKHSFETDEIADVLSLLTPLTGNFTQQVKQQLGQWLGSGREGSQWQTNPLALTLEETKLVLLGE